MSSIASRTLTGVAIAAAAAGLIALDRTVPHGVIVWGVCACLALGAIGELSAMLARREEGHRFALSAAGVAAFAVAYLQSEQELWPTSTPALRLVGPAVAAAFVGFVLGRGRLRVGLLAVWIAVPLVALVFWTRGFGHGALGALIVVSKSGDIAGYFIGRRFGKHRPFPRLSPGKTVAGCVASLIAGVVAGTLCARFWTLGPAGFSLLGGAVAGLVLNLAAQYGDLLESAVKRRAGVKDSGVVMGAAGGLLDVLDSFLLTAPVAWLILPQIAAGTS
jgi:CDP-diglyceride synthetase